MSKDDPEGVDTRSEKEKRDREDQRARDFLSLPPPPTDNPEGVPGSDDNKAK